MQQQHPPYERYNRQVILKGFGVEGQQKLHNASVLVVGAGGLGCPALQYLTAAGVGKIGITDGDVVSLHNLHRQVLYTTADVGSTKTVVAAKRLRQMNADVDIIAYDEMLTTKNALRIIGGYDLVIDGTDNFASRYLINDACVLLNKPLVYGAIAQFEGQVAVFNAPGGERVNYRHLFPTPPSAGSVQSCAESGVLGVLPGIIGTMQATEAIKLITGIGKPLINQLLTYNALTNESFIFSLKVNDEASALAPKTAKEYEAMNYEWICDAPAVDEIDAVELNAMLRANNTQFIDVREEGEQPTVTGFLHEKIPLSMLEERLHSITDDTVVLFCQSGVRSRQAAGILANAFGNTKKIYSLKGGIIQWKEHGKRS